LSVAKDDLGGLRAREERWARYAEVLSEPGLKSSVLRGLVDFLLRNSNRLNQAGALGTQLFVGVQRLHGLVFDEHESQACLAAVADRLWNDLEPFVDTSDSTSDGVIRKDVAQVVMMLCEVVAGYHSERHQDNLRAIAGSLVDLAVLGGVSPQKSYEILDQVLFGGSLSPARTPSS